MTVEQAIKMPTPEHEILATQAFGVPLDVLMQDGTGILPRPVRECISFIRYNGLATEGLFRRSPPSTALRAAKDMYNRGYNVDLSLSGVHVAAVLLKLFFRELPSPVFGSASYETILALPSVQPETDSAADREDSEVNEVAKQMDTVRARYVEEVLLPSLTFEYRQLLCFTCALLAVIARNKEINRMSAYNLAVVWSPNLARSANPMVDVAMCSAGPQSSTVGSVIQIFVQFFDSVFNSEIEMVLGKERKAQCTDLASEMLNVVDNMNRMANLAHVNHTTVFEYLQTGDASSPPALPQRHGGVPPPVPPKVPPRLPARLEAEAPPVPPKGEPAVGVAAPEDIVAAALPTAASEAETEAPVATDGAREAAISPAPEHESPKEEEAKPAEPKVEEKKLEEPKVEEEAVSEPVVEDVAESKKVVEEDEPTEVFEEATAEIVSPEAAAAPGAAPVEALADDLAETTVNDADKEDDKPTDDASEEPAKERDAENVASDTKAAPAGGKKKKVIKKKRANQGSSNSSN
ncbi:hypothetical protein EC988_001921 [Linderina pennispora]|nr:hypothetical protein EC988_001921 [Linderina pennispora]